MRRLISELFRDLKSDSASVESWLAGITENSEKLFDYGLWAFSNSWRSFWCRDWYLSGYGNGRSYRVIQKCQNYIYILIYSNKSQKIKIKMKITRIEILKIIPTKTEVYHHKPKSRTGWDILNCCKWQWPPGFEIKRDRYGCKCRWEGHRGKCKCAK